MKIQFHCTILWHSEYIVFILILHETAYLSVFLNKNTSVQTKCYFVFYPLIS